MAWAAATVWPALEFTVALPGYLLSIILESEFLILYFQVAMYCSILINRVLFSCGFHFLSAPLILH